MDTLPASQEVLQGEVTRPHRSYGKVILSTGIIVASILLVAAAILWSHPHTPSHDWALNEVWGPLLDGGHGILVCVGESEMLNAAGTSDMPQIRPDNDSLIQAYDDKRDFVPFPDVQAFSRFSTFLETRGHAFHVQSSPTTIYSQLRESPTLLIGPSTTAGPYAEHPICAFVLPAPAVATMPTGSRISSTRIPVHGKSVHWIREVRCLRTTPSSRGLPTTTQGKS